MKLHRFFAILMMIVLGASFFVACGDINGGVTGNSGDNGSGTNDNGTNITITETSISICITSYPDKVYYQVNEIFDPTGLVLSAVITERYPDGTEKNITEEIAYPNENISFSGTDFSTAGTKTITVTYTENETSKSATFEITVKSAAFSSTINYTKFDSELNADLSLYNGKAMTLYLDTTTVNIATLFTQFETLYDAVGENGSVSISYANAANTTIEGELYMNNHLDMNAVNEKRYAHIKSFVDAIKTSVSNNNYPTINMSMTSRTMTDETPFNLYHTGIADLLNLYYNNDMGDKISSFSTSSSAEFDAVDYLNRDERGDLKGKVYDNQEEYIEDSYYNLDVNAALLMGADLKNVNVVGKLKENFKGVSTLTNVRFNVDSNGNTFEFGENVAGIGLIEFAGDAPSVTPSVKSGRLVLHNVDSEIAIYGGFSIDVSKVSEDAISNYVNKSSATFIEAFYPTEESAKSSKFTPDSLYINGVLTRGSENYKATNQQWVEAGITGEFSSYPESDRSYPSSLSNLSAKAKLDEKNNTLLNTILFNNQKVYNS